MQKIPTLFRRDYSVTPAKVINVVTPGCEWVINGEGQASEKYDGACCMIRGGFLYRRYTFREGKPLQKGLWIPAQPEPDEQGNWPGWVLVDFKEPADKWYLDALAYYVADNVLLADGTYELVGPKVNGNPYSLNKHFLWRHGQDILLTCPRNFADLEEWLKEIPVEGIVWHNDDGKMAKLKRRDFGLVWPKPRGG